MYNQPGGLIVSDLGILKFYISFISKSSSIVLISTSREFANKRQGRHFSTTEKIIPSAKIVANFSTKNIQKCSAGQKVATETFMIREKEALLKQHCQLSK